MENNIYGYRPDMVEERADAFSFSALMNKVYLWMTLALAVTGLTAYYIAHNEALVYTIFNNSAMLWGTLIAELALVWILSACINRISFAVAGLMFAGYSILNGVTCSVIFLAYTKESIASTFLITAGTFGAMSLLGFFIKKDLSTMGRVLFMALIGLIIATIVNFFVASSTLTWAITYVGVFIFCGLTAYDTQKMKELLQHESYQGNNNMMKIALLCSLTLYLDFINLFLYLLRILGNKK